jgi:hypothetical protein
MFLIIHLSFIKRRYVMAEKAKKFQITKYHGGGLGHLSDPDIPKAEVEIYLRSKNGETFYASSLDEGMLHLLSNEGYRLGISVWPDGAGFDRDCYKITIRRDGNRLTTELIAPMLKYDPRQEPNTIKWDFSEKPAREELGEVEVISLNEVLDLPEPELAPEDPKEEVEVIIDGT